MRRDLPLAGRKGQSLSAGADSTAHSMGDTVQYSSTGPIIVGQYEAGECIAPSTFFSTFFPLFFHFLFHSRALQIIRFHRLAARNTVQYCRVLQSTVEYKESATKLSVWLGRCLSFVLSLFGFVCVCVCARVA